MRRSRAVPSEVLWATAVVAMTLVAGVAVLLGSVGSRDEGVLATLSRPAAETPATTAPAAGEPNDRGEQTSPGAPPTPSGPSPASTTTTTAAPATTSTTVTAPEEAPADCPGLVSETFWDRTGDRSPLAAAAGASAGYVEIVTNRSDQDCRLETNRCGTTAQLRTADGEEADAPALVCPAFSHEVVLRPGEARQEELEVHFPVPPGDYRAHVRGYDGVEVVLPVRLDDRLPACDPEGLWISNGEGEQLIDREHLRERGFDLQLVISGADQACTVRVTESRLVVDGPDGEVELVDETERWSVPIHEDDIHSHVEAPAVELSPGRHDLTVTVVLAGGGELTAPFRLLVA